MTGTPGQIAVSGLSKVFGGKVRAVDNLSFTVEPGTVTGFLGPNGAGKTTTLRMVLGLVAPTSGRATIGGRTYAELPQPAREVGAVLEASSFHPARTGRDHLRVYCAASRLPDRRADEALDLVGLAKAARRKVRGYSLGMRQRLGLAAALIGDPKVLVLDEPANGLDPEGIAWLRSFLRRLASEDGRTVLVSSHVLSEVEQTVDQVVIINRGRLVRQGALAELADGHGQAVLVRSPQIDRLSAALDGQAGSTARVGADGLRVTGMEAARIGHLAYAAGVELHELATQQSLLEEVFLALTTNADMGAPEIGPAETGPAETGAAETGAAESGPAETDPAETGARA